MPREAERHPDKDVNAAIEAMSEAGCTDASIGHRTVEFDREASTR
ncbi:hypothetical protein [Candidatus Poriferisodalis sp.]